MSEMRDLSVVPSPDDSRDHMVGEVYAVARKIVGTPPATLDLRPSLRPVRDQGTTSTCAAQVAACIKEYQELFDTKVHADFSAQFVYYHRVNKPADGMYGRDVMKILNKKGTSTEGTYPFNSTEQPSAYAIQQGTEYTINEYAQVNTIGELKQALVSDGPCYIAFPVYNYGLTMWKPEPGQRRNGGHAMTVVGYTKNGFIIRNSWGSGWGDNGYCIYPYDHFGAHWEIWTTVDREGSRAPNVLPSGWHCGICATITKKARGV